MNLLIYILVYPLIWCISILPFKVLYFVSDFIYLILYYIIGYRKDVVLYNLTLAFPEKSKTELIQIRKKFYHHFVDVFMEMIKTFTISKRELDKHYVYKNIDLLNDLAKDGKSVILTGAHYANWEWIMGLTPFMKYQGVAAYTKLSNPYFEKKMLQTRGRFGVILKKTNRIIAEITKNSKGKKQFIYGLLSDQSPQLKKTFYWKEFFGVKVPIHTGSEMLAKKHDLNLVFMDVKKVKRGYYETTFSIITSDAKKYADYELTDIFLDKVEKQIRLQPEYYFWTHKRFKHKDKAPKN